MDGSPTEAAKQVAGESRAWSTLDHYPLVLVVCRDGFSMAEMEECLMPSEEAFRRKKISKFSLHDEVRIPATRDRWRSHRRATPCNPRVATNHRASRD